MHGLKLSKHAISDLCHILIKLGQTFVVFCGFATDYDTVNIVA